MAFFVKSLNRWIKSALGSSGNLEGVDGGWDEVRRKQDKFQEEYCAHCEYFDLKLGDFKKKTHPYRLGDCTWHWTDLLGTCHNFRWRKDG